MFYYQKQTFFCFHDPIKKFSCDFLLRKTRKNAFFAIFAHEMGSQLLKNNVSGLTASNYPLFWTLTHLSSPPGGEMLTGNIFGVPSTHSVTLIFFKFDNIYMFIMAKNGNFHFSGPLTKKLGGDGGVTIVR